MKLKISQIRSNRPKTEKIPIDRAFHTTIKRARGSSCFIPVLIFIFLSLVYGFTSYFSNPSPVIDSISPEIGYPGETLELTGKHFGEPSPDNKEGLIIKPVDASVYIGRERLVLSDYLIWNDKKIRIRIPSDIASGGVFVENKSGKSNEITFINRKEIPVVISGPVDPGQPYISSFEPTVGAVSDVITLNGMNFGMEKEKSQVYFSLDAANSGVRSEAAEDLSISASDVDYDYSSWTDNEIKVKVPDGASSGKMWVKTDRGTSNSVYFEKTEISGTRSYGEKRGYQVRYEINLNAGESGEDNNIYIWVPRLSASPEQRKIEYERNITPELDNYHNLMLYRFANLKTRETKSIVLNVWFERYEVLTHINRNKTSWNYDKETQFYREFTRDLYLLKLDDPGLDAAFKKIGRHKEPYSAAESIYRIVRTMNYVISPSEKDVIANFQKLTGDSYTYAMVFTALARKAGIPARPVAGFLVFDNKKTVKHFWAEFYIKGFGWIPVDPALGDGAAFGNIPQVENPSDYYFGNLDSNHITFSRGIITVPVISPNGKSIFKNKMYSLQTAYEEVSGDIKSYTIDWNDLKIIEWW
ncbi:MAG: IPT/TIG domain-containing protein [Spirochaetales bacterium]|nr:IPT/TIG domain-containing protein [Spirochaetales bacterium]